MSATPYGLSHVLANAVRDDLSGLVGLARARKYASIAMYISELANYDPVLTSDALEAFSGKLFHASQKLGDVYGTPRAKRKRGAR